MAPAVSAAQTPSTPQAQHHHRAGLRQRRPRVGPHRAPVARPRRPVPDGPRADRGPALLPQRPPRRGRAAAAGPVVQRQVRRSSTFPFTSRTRGRIVVRATHFATPAARDAEGQGRRRVGRVAERAPRLPRARSSGCCRASSRSSATSSAGPALRRPHRPRRPRVPQDHRDAADDDRQRRRLPAPRRRRRRVPHPLPEPRQARRGRPLAPGHRADPQRQGRAHLPGELRQAVDADDPGPLPRLPQGAGHERQGHVHVELLHPRLRDPRLPVGAGVPGQPRLPAGPTRRPSRSSTGCRGGDIVDVYA